MCHHLQFTWQIVPQSRYYSSFHQWAIPNWVHFQEINCFKNETNPKISVLYVVLLMWPIFGNILFFKQQILISRLEILSKFIVFPFATFDVFLTNLSLRTFSINAQNCSLVWILVAVGSSGILKAKQKLNVTFNFDKQDVIDFIA